MANFGKFIDRSPDICAAGRSTSIVNQDPVGSNRESDTVGECEFSNANQYKKIHTQDPSVEQRLFKNGKEEVLKSTADNHNCSKDIASIIEDVPRRDQHFETTSHAADYLVTHHSEMSPCPWRPAAGLPAYEEFPKASNYPTE